MILGNLIFMLQKLKLKFKFQNNVACEIFELFNQMIFHYYRYLWEILNLFDFF